MELSAAHIQLPNLEHREVADISRYQMCSLVDRCCRDQGICQADGRSHPSVPALELAGLIRGLGRNDG